MDALAANKLWYDQKHQITIGDEQITIPLWVVIVTGFAVVVFVGICVAIGCLFHKNLKQNQMNNDLLDSELRKCEEEGIELPEELQKRLARARMRRSSRRGTEIHPEDDIEGKDGKGKGGRGGLTRYASNVNDSELKGLKG